MVKKIEPTKVSNVKSTNVASEVGAVKGTSSVTGVKGAKAVRGVSKTSGAGTMSAAQKEKLLAMAHEEADRMFDEGILPKSQRDVVKSAVRMALDAAIISDDDEGEEKK